MEHGRRHQPLELMTMADNVKYSRHKEVKGAGYTKYDNYTPSKSLTPTPYQAIAMASWACRYPSLTNTAPNSSR